MESSNLGEKMEKTISIAHDFNKFPAGRYLTDGPYNGEKFRIEYLTPALNDKKISILRISLDGLGGVGSSFWDEAFGGLILKDKIPYHTIKQKLQLICKEDEALSKLVWDCIEEAKDVSDGQ